MYNCIYKSLYVTENVIDTPNAATLTGCGTVRWILCLTDGGMHVGMYKRELGEAIVAQDWKCARKNYDGMFQIDDAVFQNYCIQRNPCTTSILIKSIYFE